MPAAKLPHIRAVVFDWAGTIVDYGSAAPVTAFREIFRRNGVEVDVPTARAPMGSNKRDHIQAIMNTPHVTAAWTAAHGGAAPTEKDVDALYEGFTPIQVEVVRTRAAPIPGAVELVAALRHDGVRVGGCSGYNAAIMAVVIEQAGQQGLTLDAVVCANAAGSNGRPKPFMSTAVCEKLDAFPLRACVKVDDTPIGILEGLNAGMWTVGVSRSGNELGLDEEAAAALPAEELKARLEVGRAHFMVAGAHYVVESVADLMPVLQDIERRLAAGEAPPMPQVAMRG